MNLYHCGGLASGRIATAEQNLSNKAFPSPLEGLPMCCISKWVHKSSQELNSARCSPLSSMFVSIASSVCHGEGSKWEEQNPSTMVSHSPEPRRFFQWIDKLLEFEGQQHAGSYSVAAPHTYSRDKAGMSRSSHPFYLHSLNVTFDLTGILPVDDRKNWIHSSQN